jgi:hypothetical protein
MSKLETNPAHMVADAEALVFSNLPLAARDYVEQWRAAEDRIRDEQRVDADRQQVLARELMEAENHLRTVQRAYDDAPNATSKDLQFVKSQEAVRDSKKARLDKHQQATEKKRDARAKSRTLSWQEKGEDHARKRWHVPHRDIPGAPLPEANATIDALEGVRGKITAANAAIKAAQKAPLTVVEAFQAFKRRIESELKNKAGTTGLGGFFHVDYNERGDLLPYSPTINIERIGLLSLRELILSWGENRLREIGDLHAFDCKKPLSHAQRKKQIQKLRAEIDKLEIEEGRVIRALAAKGVFVPLRADTVSLNAVLGIEPDTDAIASRKLATEAA